MKYKRIGFDTLKGKMLKEMDTLEFNNSLVLNKSFNEKTLFGKTAIPIITKIVWYRKSIKK